MVNAVVRSLVALDDPEPEDGGRAQSEKVLVLQQELPGNFQRLRALRLAQQATGSV